MANPFAYEEYRKDKIRQEIEESRTQRVQVKVRGSPTHMLLLTFCLTHFDNQKQMIANIRWTFVDASKTVSCFTNEADWIKSAPYCMD